MILSRNQLRFRGSPDQEQHAADRATPKNDSSGCWPGAAPGRPVSTKPNHATSVLRWDGASIATQQDFEINPRAHKLRITRKQRLAGLQLARLSNGGDYCTENSPVSDRRVQVGVGKLPREIMQSRVVTDQKHRLPALRKVPELLP